jgi:hypothetical protein
VALVIDSKAPPSRCAIRPDAEGFSVYDILTGQPLRLAMAAQIGLSAEDAEHTARLFNERADRGERVSSQ